MNVAYVNAGSAWHVRNPDRLKCDGRHTFPGAAGTPRSGENSTRCHAVPARALPRREAAAGRSEQPLHIPREYAAIPRQPMTQLSGQLSNRCGYHQQYRRQGVLARLSPTPERPHLSGMMIRGWGSSASSLEPAAGAMPPLGGTTRSVAPASGSPLPTI